MEANTSKQHELRLEQATLVRGCLSILNHGNSNQESTESMRKESKHTPGPWRYCLVDARKKNNIFMVTHPPTENYGAIVPTVYGENNARLIAAAPELLEACKAALEERTGAASGPVGYSRNITKLLQDAIAKATKA